MLARKVARAFGLELKSSVGVKLTFPAFYLTRTVPTRNVFIKQNHDALSTSKKKKWR
jgi:hypothetical protein